MARQTILLGLLTIALFSGQLGGQRFAAAQSPYAPLTITAPPQSGVYPAVYPPVYPTTAPPVYPSTNSYPSTDATSYPSTGIRLASTGFPVVSPVVVPNGEGWISPAPTGTIYGDAHLYEPSFADEPAHYPAGPTARDFWHWQLLPDGLIYRSYMAGPREPRISTVFLNERQTDQTLWDPILGGRMPLFRFGDDNSMQPQGWQLDIEGAAIVRLNLDADRDLDASDFRFGIPLTYGVDNWQVKFGYYHLSSHQGDEFLVRTTPPATPIVRRNYVRDAIIFGGAFYPVPSLRLYGETAYAFFAAGGAEPWEFQFGMEYSRPGYTGARGTPFLAANAHLRQEHDFGGDLTVQTGWLWRGHSGHMLRVGLHYLNGKSSQYQFLNDSEQQLGFGLWYDF